MIWGYHDHMKVGITTTCYFFGAIVLSVLLRYTDSDYPFGIFKLVFLHKLWVRIQLTAKCNSIQDFVIKFVSDLWQVGGFLQVLWFPPPIKLTATI